MKFSKFVKSLAPDGGAIYEYMDERWLASPSVLMLIPDGIRSVTGYSNEKMPDGIGRLISQVGCTEYATLVKAIMPVSRTAQSRIVSVSSPRRTAP